VAQGIEHHAVLLRAAQQTLRPLTIDVLGHGDPRRAPDRLEPDRVVTHRKRAARVPIGFDLDLERLQRDPHAGGHHPHRCLLARRESSQQEIAGAGDVAGSAHRRVSPGPPGDVGRRVGEDGAVQRVVQVTRSAADSQPDLGTLRLRPVALAQGSLPLPDVDLRGGQAPSFVEGILSTLR